MIDDVGIHRVLLSSNRPFNALQITRSKNGSRQRGFVPESAWIAHCKELFGPAAHGTSPHENPCPPEKFAAIKQAFRPFGLLSD